jgi:hypothetical protein
LKTNVKRTGKYINREKTPPIHPHKNPVAKITCPSLIDHLKLQKEVFWQSTALSSSKEPHRSNHFTLKSSE